MPTYRITSAEDKEELKREIDRLKEGVRFDVKISRHLPKRSIPQNRTYWMWINCISDETGHTAQEVHEVLKSMFLGMEIIEALNTTTQRPVSTTKLSVTDFSSYMEKVQAWAASEMAIRLPNPEDLAWADFYEHYGQRYG